MWNDTGALSSQMVDIVRLCQRLNSYYLIILFSHMGMSLGTQQWCNATPKQANILKVKGVWMTSWCYHFTNNKNIFLKGNLLCFICFKNVDRISRTALMI